MKRCKDCAWWDERECRKVDFALAKQFYIDVKVADDHGLEVKLMTGPEFGCVEFQTLVDTQNQKAEEIIDKILAEMDSAFIADGI